MLDMKQFDGRKVRVTYQTTDTVDEGYALYDATDNTMEIFHEESWNGGYPDGTWISFIQPHEGGLLADLIGDESMVSNIELLD